MLDVAIAGAGPAGSITGLLLARAGARVLIVDRDTFPRDKLCGDTLNPGAVRSLAARGVSGGPLEHAVRLRGMLISGPRNAVTARYPGDEAGLAVTRRTLDAWLLGLAIEAGVRFETGLTVRAPLMQDDRQGARVRGLVMTSRATGAELRLPAMLTIAADGRRSVLARALDLVHHPQKPRRWAFGVYAQGVEDVGDIGEMHIRPRWYAGVAPMGGGVSNICVVTGPRPDGRTPEEVVRRALASDAGLRRRTESARFVSPVRVLGPLAVDARGVGAPGLLLAGDAAGFVDPMTGDGLHLAITSAGQAADAALGILESGDFAAGLLRLAQERRASLGRKQRFNRVLRRFVDSPVALELAGWGARVLPGAVRRAVWYAGDAA